MIQLIIYDLDGTLIDSSRDIAEAVNWTLKKMGLKELAVEQISSFVGNGVAHLMRQALKEARPPKEIEKEGEGILPLVERSIKLFRRRYGAHLLDETRLYPSVRKVLEFFKNRKQAVLTNKPAEFSLKILRALEIDSYFFKVVGGDEGFPKKPAPDAVLEILREAGVSPDETMLVGDSALDVETGRNACVKTGAVTYGFGKRAEIESSLPHLILEDLSELIKCPLLKN